MVSQDKVSCTKSGNTNKKKISWVNFEFLENHRCSEGAKTGFKQLIVEFVDIIVPF